MPCCFEAAPPEILAGVLDQSPDHTIAPAAYWKRLKPGLRSMGISRTADITGLDRLGLPVVQAVRPDARSNAVTQGKASTKEGAAVGAVLECLEMAAGECLDRFPTVPARDVQFWAPLAPGLPDGMVWPDANTDFIACWDITADRCSALPRDLISTDFRQDAPAAVAPILRHSIGLGAGSSFASAVMHGLLECLEADARLRDEWAGGARRLALSPSDASYGALLKTVAAKGLRVAVDELPCQGGTFCVKASVMEQPGMTALPLPAVGYGARLTPSEAISAALTEALQARLAVISGAREDITQRFYLHRATSAELDAEWHRHAPHPFAAQPIPPTPVTMRDIAVAVGPVLAVPLHWDARVPLAIVRVVVPNLIADPMRLSQP